MTSLSDTPSLRQKLPKSQRLCGRSHLNLLFTKGKAISTPHLRLHYLLMPHLPTTQFMVGVPKKVLPKAVNRNKMRRRIKEAYRLEKNRFLSLPPCFHLAFIYKAPPKQLVPYGQIHQEVVTLLTHLKKRHTATS